MARPNGIDISKWQAPQDLNKPHGIVFPTMVDKADFMFVRAGFAGSAGGAWVDPRVHEYMEDLWEILDNHPIPFSFYWYFRDDVSVMDQVNRFSAVVNRWKGVVNMPLVVDAEAFTKGNAVSTQKIIDFQIEVERQTGLKVDILYGRAGQLNAETVPGMERGEILPYLFVARYQDGLDPQVDEPWDEGGVQEYVEPRDWDTWKFWQYTEDGDEKRYGVTAGAVGIDENVFNGTMEELRAFANLDKPVEPEEDWDLLSVCKVEQKVTQVPFGGTAIEYFPSTKGFMTPKFVSVEAPPKTKFKVELLIGSIPVPLASRTVYSSRYATYVFPDRLTLEKGDGVLVTAESLDGGRIETKLVHK